MSYFQNILFIADNCRILQFLEAKDGSALEKHIIRTIALNSEHSCRVQCYLENPCVSYNFGKRVAGDEVCELNNSTDIQHPDDLKPRVNFIYLSHIAWLHFLHIKPTHNPQFLQSL